MLKSTIYNKLLLQAEEAKELGLTKLADGITNSIGAYSDDTPKEYSYSQLEKDVYSDLWKVATKIIDYHDLQSVQAEKLDEMIEVLADQVLTELRKVLTVDNVIKSINEPKIPGEE